MKTWILIFKIACALGFLALATHFLIVHFNGLERKDLIQINEQLKQYVDGHYSGKGGKSNDMFYLQNGERYRLTDIEGSYFDSNSFMNNVSEGQTINILVDPKNDNEIMMVKVGNVSYLTLDDAYRAEKKNKNLGLYGGIFLIVLAVITLEIPNKYYLRKDLQKYYEY